jgi:hypothetical protein
MARATDRDRWLRASRHGGVAVIIFFMPEVTRILSASGGFAVRMFRSPFLLVLAVSFSCSSVRAADTVLDAKSTERLVSLCKVWGTVRYLHPYLAHKEIDWDAALIAALPKVEAAKDDNELRAAVRAMLDRLGDPGTRVAYTASQPPMDQGVSSAKVKDHPLFSWVESDFLATLWTARHP